MADLLLRLRSFLAEVRKRRVFRVAAVYAAAAFTVGQAVSVAFPALHLPSWTITFVVVSLLVGFPVAILLAWAFDLTLIRGGVAAASPAAPALGEDLPAAPQAEAVGTGLPPQPTPFVGRVRELDEIAMLLGDATCRLVTVTGPGGVGKTRLALQAAEASAPAFAHGVRFIPLSALRTADSLVSTIAEHLGLTPLGCGEPRIQLLDYLREKQLLLVLDNFEHLAEGGGLLAAILESAVGVKLMVTSRERLSLHGETIVAIRGLDYPPADPAEEVERLDAVRLFLQSARRVDPSFSPEAGEMSAVLRVCRLVEGMPLAIELAAAWTRVLSCAEIASEISHDLDFLTGSTRDVPERHRSLRAVFESSWRLLSAEEQRVFQRMSVFRGGFRRDAAERVAGASLALLTTLLDKSLLRRSSMGRFEILEVLRQQALEKLAGDRQEELGTYEAHCDYYSELLYTACSRLDGAEETEVLGVIGADIENIRRAWHWSIAEGSLDRLARAWEGLFVFYDSRGRAREGEEDFGRAAAAVQRLGSDGDREKDGRAGILARLLARQGVFCYRLGRYGDAAELLQHAAALCQEVADRPELAFTLDKQGLLAYEVGDYGGAKRLHTESLQLYRELRDHRGTGRSLTHLGNVEYALGNYSDARKLYREGLGILERHGDRSGLANALCNLGIIAAIEKDDQEAERFFEAALATARELENKRGIAQALQNLGCLASDAGRHSQAEAYLREGVAISREMGFRRLLAFCLNELGNVFASRGDPAAAREYYHQALATAVDIQETPIVMEILIGVARLLSKREEQRERALTLLFLILHHPASDQAARDGAALHVAEIEAWVPAAAVRAAAERASALQVDDIVAETMESLGPPGARVAV